MSKKTHVQTTINGEAVEFLCEPRLKRYSWINWY